MDRYIPCKRPKRLENIARRPYTKNRTATYEIDVEQYEELLRQGLNNKQIAEKVGMRYDKLTRWRELHGYVKRQKQGRNRFC